MIRQLRLVQFIGAVGFVSSLCLGCSGTEQPAPGPVAGAAPAATGGSSATDTVTGESHRAAPKCTDMQVRECRVELGAQGAVQNCFVGLQLCKNGKWGPCQDADEVEAQLSGD